MIVIKNRVNTSNELSAVPSEYGVEVDVRERGALILQNEPFADGEALESYLRSFKHKFIIFDIKSEGIEFKVIELAESAGIKDYFLLGISATSAKKLINREFRKFAVRFSDMEALETCSRWVGRAEWVWADIFRDFPLDEQNIPVLKKNFKICAISPEVIGLRGALERYRGKMKLLGIDAICTDLPDLWK